MANYTISGILTEPDDVTPWRGYYYIGIYSSTGIAIDGDGSWRAGENRLQTDPSTGAATITLPETTGDEIYVLRFESFRGEIKGPWGFTLTANITWGDIIENPNPLPPLPSLAGEIADRLAAEGLLFAALSAETAARDDADDALYAAINAIETGGSSHIEEDTDGVPYYDLTLPGGLRLLVDTDGIPYYMTGA